MNLNQIQTMLNSHDQRVRKQAEAYLNSAKNNYNNTKQSVANMRDNTIRSVNTLFVWVVLGLVAWVVISTVIHNNQPQEYKAGEINTEAQIEELEAQKSEIDNQIKGLKD